jgi:DNA-binding CsgD family transcriptional regulator
LPHCCRLDIFVKELLTKKLWHDLLERRIRVSSCSPDGYEIVLVHRGASELSSRGRDRQNDWMVAVLQGQSQKSVAADYRCAQSTLAGALNHTAGELGAPGQFRRLPLALALLAHAAAAPGLLSLRYAWGGHAVSRWSVRAEIPEGALRGLSYAERAVMRPYLAGGTHAQIASARNTSPRTIANQLSSAFAKLGSSGRFELLCCLVQRGAHADSRLSLTMRADTPVTALAPSDPLPAPHSSLAQAVC